MNPHPPDSPITVACYYFPNYHPSDPRNEQAHGKGWCEWELVKNAKPRFPGHEQPKIPLWGYTDESDSNAMAQKIDAAADHGINAFIFDWYWYQGPFLEGALNNGFLKAKNRDRLKFALMWANHDWGDGFPARRGIPSPLLYSGKVDAKEFDVMCDHVINEYFVQPNYWTIEGKPYFSIYEINRLVQSFGGMAETQAALNRFQQKARAAGLPGIHFNVVVWGLRILPNEQAIENPVDLIQQLGFKSVNSYVWVHHVPMPGQSTDYDWACDRYFAYFDETEKSYPVPCFPNVTMGWDPSPRAHQQDEFGDFGYPFTNTLSGNTPARFQNALEKAKKRLLHRTSGPKMITINCWNEWTEGSYLEPDTKHGFAYLDAVKKVFPPL